MENTIKITTKTATFSIVVKPIITIKEMADFISEVKDIAFVGGEYSSIAKEIGYVKNLLSKYTNYKFKENHDYFKMYDDVFECIESIESKINERQLQIIKSGIEEEIKIERTRNTPINKIISSMSRKVEMTDLTSVISQTVDMLKNIDKDTLDNLVKMTKFSKAVD